MPTIVRGRPFSRRCAKSWNGFARRKGRSTRKAHGSTAIRSAFWRRSAEAKGEHPHPNGTLALKRKPAGEGGLTLEVDFTISTRGPSGARTRASLTCAADRLATPRQWELRAEAVEKGEPVAETTVARPPLCATACSCGAAASSAS